MVEQLTRNEQVVGSIPTFGSIRPQYFAGFFILEGILMLKINGEKRLLDAVADICLRIRDAGGRAVMVGGCVRDAIMGSACKDIDLECYGISAENILSCLSGQYGVDLVGASFGVMKVKHFDIDIALPRTENKTGYGHRGFMVDIVPGMSFADAASRRDFTINAIMYDPLTAEIIDPWNGQDDLQKGLLRHVSGHFMEDPLRVLRAMQFTARFGFRVAEETVEVCRSMSQDELPAERLSAEWEKLLLKGVKPSLGLDFLRECGWIRYYPELEALIGCEQTPVWHPEGDVWRHTLLCLDEAAKLRSKDDDDLVLMLAVLCHDLGKPATTFVRKDGRIVSPGHDAAGKAPALSFINRIWHRNDLPERVLPLVEHHMAPAQFVKGNAGDRAYRRLALEVQRLDLLAKLARCDVISTGVDVPGRLKDLDVFLERAHSLNVEKEVPRPILLGRHLIAMGIAPGPEMGKLLSMAFEAQLDGAFNDLDGALRFIKEHA